MGPVDAAGAMGAATPGRAGQTPTGRPRSQALPSGTLRPITPVAPALPGRAFIRQGWRDVVFLHWRIPAADVAPLLPAGTRPDTLPGDDDAGWTWVGLIGFVFADTAFPPLPPMRRLGTFVEMNVRVYTVDARGRRGVVFLSLDAGRLPPVLAARAMLGLPYMWAHAEIRRDSDVVGYAARRHGSGVRSRMDVRIGEPIAEPTELDQFLTARWGMHVERLGTTRFGTTLFWPNEHSPWPLRSAEATFVRDEFVTAAGLPASITTRPPDSVLYSPGVVTTFAIGHP